MMKQQHPIDKFDNVGALLKDTDREIAIAHTAIANDVLERIKQRRRGVRRLAVGSTALLALVLVTLVPVLLNFDQQKQSSMAKRATNEPTNELKSYKTSFDPLESMLDQFEMNESRKKLQRLKSELAQLDRVEHEQHLVLAGERLSRSIFSQTNNPYPVFLGD